MKKGFSAIMAAQFFSSLADNALLIAAIALLQSALCPAWMTPLLKLFFVLSYVLLAPFVGEFADAMPKGRVMLLTNGIKIAGCALMIFGSHPLIAYGIVGLGAAAYSPAKYGILTELLPAEKLVMANGWIEGLTVVSIILGTALGGLLINPNLYLNVAHFFSWDATVQSIAVTSALCIVVLVYVLATLFNLFIPDTGARYPSHGHRPVKLVFDFIHCFKVLWKDKLGQISLAVTTLFWGAGAVLQFIVLKWAEQTFAMSLSEASLLPAAVAIGVAIGAVIASIFVPLKRSLKVLPAGVLMGLVLFIMAFHSKSLFPEWSISVGLWHVPFYLFIAYVLLIVLGLLAGFFVVPMNALLQHRGYVLLSAGHSIAVQNFNENLAILFMLGLYAVLISLNIPIQYIIMLFGFLVILVMGLTMRWHRLNQQERDWAALIGEKKQELK